MIDFPKNFEPNANEPKWYSLWKENKLFSSDNSSTKPKYSILMPPPNVTGILHFGHVLNHTLQDIYIRWKRMNGYEVCWYPGLDHAGIATQSRVEKELKATENLTRYDLGRDKFLERVWGWKEQYGNIILNQLESIGVSCDWDKTLFTMDDSASKSVTEIFVRLFDAGLIYKGKRIINWSPVAQTALSDEEVEFRQVQEHLYTLKYYFADGSGYLQVATVRPETIYGDVAVAVNPNDERYKHLIGTQVIVPLVGRSVPIVADDYAEIGFGTGCVKITPAHDPNDFELGKRHNLEMINTINPDGTLNELTGEFAGMERFAARKAMMVKLQEAGLVEKVEDYTHNVGYSQRGGEPIEPYLSDQWFVSMQALTKKAAEVVANGEIQFYPNHWTKTYDHWMKNIKDWCISRQLWWGHRIPVYYTADGKFTAARNEAEARQKLNIPQEVELNQDNDVLDTWFSSWLWPMTTMGWDGTDETLNSQEVKAFLPTDLLVTGPDIIFFWVARMIIATEEVAKVIPFKNVYFTSMIRDASGRKLSKSLGNSPDPLNIIDKYGADATRFTMIYLAPLGLDVRMDINVETQDIPSMEIGRNFLNKVWNAGRFLNMRREAIEAEEATGEALENISFDDVNEWIEIKLSDAIEKINTALDNFNVNEYSKTLYEFIWKEFCDQYVEMVKTFVSQNISKELKLETVAKSLEVYKNILKLLHPTMPFVTEELWHILFESDANKSISVADYPQKTKDNSNFALITHFELMQTISEEIRMLKAQANIANQKTDLIINTEDSAFVEFLQRNLVVFNSNIKAKSTSFNTQSDSKKLSSATRGIELNVLIEEDSIDVEAEKLRISKELERLHSQIDGINRKLSNVGFVAKAPENVIAAERKKLADMSDSVEKLKLTLSNL